MAGVSTREAEARRRAWAQRSALKALRAVYRLADAAHRPYSCPASGECCQLAVTKREPWLWPVEWQMLLAASGGPVPPPRGDGACPFLDVEGRRCSVYASRPFACRTFYCHRVRGPSRRPVEAVALLEGRLEAVARGLDPDCTGPRPLLAWAREAWGEAPGPSGPAALGPRGQG